MGGSVGADRRDLLRCAGGRTPRKDSGWGDWFREVLESGGWYGGAIVRFFVCGKKNSNTGNEKNKKSKKGG